MSTAPPTQPRPQRGDELELTIDALAFGGAGVARTDGYVVFVSGAAGAVGSVVSQIAKSKCHTVSG